MNMKVTTLNLAGYKQWTEREANIIAYLNESQSDIVFLQEVKFDTRFSPYSQSKHLNSQLRIPYSYAQACISRIYQASDSNESREGLAVLSKYPIIDSETLVLTKQPDDKHTRIIQKVSLFIQNEVVTFVNVHFSNNHHSLEQLDETLRLVKNSGEKSVILGDFNIIDLTTVSHLYEAEYTTSTEVADYISFPSESATFDYALVPNEYGLTAITTRENLSDHNALSFELEIHPANTSAKSEPLDDNARKFVVGAIDRAILEENESSSFTLTVDWLETGEDNEKKVAYKKFDNDDIQILLISKLTEGGKRTSVKEKITEETYKELLSSSVLHLEKKRHEFEYAQNNTSFSIKFDEFAESRLCILEVDAQSEIERDSFNPNNFPAKLTEVTGDIRYYGYRITDIV